MATIIECPDCGNGFSGYKCGCGYTISRAMTTPKQHIACSYEACPDPAITKEFDLKPICRRHWEIRCNERDRKYLKEHDLVTLDEKRAHINTLIRNLSNKMSATPSKQWAHNLIQRHEDGENIPDRSLELAQKALR
jgi:hypothetical protein